MRKFYVMWTFIANYSEKPWTIHADSAEQAAEKVRDGMSAEFREKGTVLVFTEPPAFIHKGDRARRTEG